ncbi:MAG: NAD(P)-dependent oxidoreductase [Bacteroidetes bacterium]|nr:MAG: NAD(P)-dependent oxidoreductase [Bacteroidota bacterium]
MQYEKRKVAFIGLGIMGSRMAMNLLKNGIGLVVYNRSKEPGELLKSAGATLANSVKEAVDGADIVFSMLSTPEVVKQVMLSEGGGLANMKKGAVWIDCSTVNPSFSLESKTASEKYGVEFLDAPVAGTKPHAENAQLTFFVGGPETLVESVRPLMDFMGQKVLHIGPLGKGASFKMLVNAMLAQSMIIFSETILLGEKMGIDKDFLLNTIPNLVVSAPFTKFKAEMIRNEKYDVQFPLEWMHKDLHLAALTAYENDQPLYLVNIAKELFADAKKSGMGRLDFAAIHDYLEKKK